MTYTTTRDRQRPTRGGAHRRSVGWSRRARVLSAVMGCVLTGGVAVAATNWLVGLNAGSSGQGKAATVSNLTITASATPTPVNQLYPGGTGDVVVTISNPNTYPVTITGVELPTNTTYAAGYSNSALSTATVGCDATTSLVAWNFATTTSGSAHTLTTAVTVGASGQANNPLVITLTNDATMASTTPSSCAGQYFSMPSLIGIAASGGAAASTTSPATDAWTS